MTPSDIDSLAVAFTVFASLWLVFAAVYMVTVCLFFRMRARGQLRGSMSDPAWGRMYIFSTGYYIPMGCIFRRYVMFQRSGEERARIAKIRVMSVEERRAAIQEFLQPSEYSNPKPAPTSLGDSYSSSDNEEDTCPVCFCPYTDEDPVFDSPMCSHSFHWACILSWLEFQSHRECPCCRVELVSEEKIWEVVKNHRRGRRGRQRKVVTCKITDQTSGGDSIERVTIEEEDDQSWRQQQNTDSVVQIPMGDSMPPVETQNGNSGEEISCASLDVSVVGRIDRESQESIIKLPSGNREGKLLQDVESLEFTTNDQSSQRERGTRPHEKINNFSSETGPGKNSSDKEEQEKAEGFCASVVETADKEEVGSVDGPFSLDNDPVGFKSQFVAL